MMLHERNPQAAIVEYLLLQAKWAKLVLKWASLHMLHCTHLGAPDKVLCTLSKSGRQTSFLQIRTGL